jgi:hypothetical protein
MAKQLFVSLCILFTMLMVSFVSVAQCQDQPRKMDRNEIRSKAGDEEQQRMRAINRSMVDSDAISNLDLRRKSTTKGTFMEWTCKSSTDECFERANNLQANGCSCSSESGGYRCECPE